MARGRGDQDRLADSRDRTAGGVEQPRVRHGRWRSDGIFGVLILDSFREFAWSSGRWIEVDWWGGRAAEFRAEYGAARYHSGTRLPPAGLGNTFWEDRRQIAVRIAPGPGGWVPAPPPPVGGAPDVRQAVQGVSRPAEVGRPDVPGAVMHSLTFKRFGAFGESDRWECSCGKTWLVLYSVATAVAACGSAPLLHLVNPDG